MIGRSSSLNYVYLPFFTGGGGYIYYISFVAGEVAFVGIRRFPQMRISLMSRSGSKLGVFHIRSLQFTWRTDLILAVPRASFGAYPWGCYPHLVPGEAGKS